MTFELAGRSQAAKFLIRDGETKFPSSFDEVFSLGRDLDHQDTHSSTTSDAFAERFVGTVRRECTDRLLVFGRTHLEQALAEYVAHYNDHRPHRSLDQQAPRTLGFTPASIDNHDPTQLGRTAVLGGIIHEYRLVA